MIIPGEGIVSGCRDAYDSSRVSQCYGHLALKSQPLPISITRRVPRQSFPKTLFAAKLCLAGYLTSLADKSREWDLRRVNLRIACHSPATQFRIPESYFKESS